MTAGGSLSEKERLAWLRLSRTENIGPITFRKLLEFFGSAERALEKLPEMSRRGGRAKPLVPFPLAEAERELHALQDAGAVLLTMKDAQYPQSLAAIDDAPPVLTVLGHAHLLQRSALAVVGARNASLNGTKLAGMLARDAGQKGYVIASGLARGIDAAAHQASLPTGTIAVVAGGIDIIYPRENEALYHRIAAEGVIVAESPLGTEPQARHFPRRNRIISGLSLGVLVVEAAPKSGSLITARLAAEQGREVFAIPGSPLDPRAQGANSLLRDGAHLVQTADDIVEILDRLKGRHFSDPATGGYDAEPAAGKAQPGEPPPAGLHEKILEKLGSNPVLVDELIRECQCSTSAVLAALLELELAGKVGRHPGNRVCRLHEGTGYLFE